MTDAELDNIKAAVALVTANVPGLEPITGTGFFIGDKYVLTALHVVADIDVSPPVLATRIKLEFKYAGRHVTEATLLAEMWDFTGDWAVLVCKNPPSVAPLARGDAFARDSEWDAFGYKKQTEGKTLKGTIRDRHARYRDADVVELFNEDATGFGMALHGFSGAPCIVSGKAFGLLRSTLTTELIGNSREPILRTDGGAVYACPAKTIVEWQAIRGIRILPGDWAPAEVVGKDFLVFQSTSPQAKLEAVAIKAREHVDDLGLGEPFFQSAAQILSSEKTLLDVIPTLCKARVVVFDATKFEPSIMLLAGIRAVVRRGVTILSVGGKYSLGANLAIPFDVIDANIVAHSKEQDDRKPTSVAMLSSRIRSGLSETRSPYYLDMPVFDALRRLPAERRGIIASDEGVLVLCSLDPAYTKKQWDKLKNAFENELALWRQKVGKKEIPTLGVARSFELNSPRLVSQAIYETIRRAQSCVVDLTGWSPNVLFELGVRLAVAPGGTACLIAKNWSAKLQNRGWRPQCASIVSLFVDQKKEYDSSAEWETELAYPRAYGQRAELPNGGPSGGSIHSLLERSLDLASEPAARPVFEELLNSAELFAKPPGGAGRSKPVGLYPGNYQLLRREEEAEFERLLAAWLYLSNRYTKKQRLDINGTETRKTAMEIIRALLLRHFSKLSEAERTSLRRMRDVLRTSEQPLHVGDRLKQIQTLKADATVLRNEKSYDEALRTFDKAISELHSLQKKGGLEESEAADVRAELADTYGMKAGTYRRTKELAMALVEYRNGLELEEIDQRSTYNASNVITLAITQENAWPFDQKMQANLERVIVELEAQTNGTRKDEWWALSDLGQFYLLSDNPAKALTAYERAKKTGPTIEECGRHCAILKDLENAVAKSSSQIAGSIQKIVRDLLGTFGQVRGTGENAPPG